MSAAAPEVDRACVFIAVFANPARQAFTHTLDTHAMGTACWVTRGLRTISARVAHITSAFAVHTHSVARAVVDTLICTAR